MITSAHILVVEDENLIALDLCRTLRRLGYRIVGPVTSGEEAITEAKKHKPDLILMDIVLKGKIDGITAAAQISDSLNIPVIFLTAYADQQSIERAKIVEPLGYIVKPIDESQLHAAIETGLYNYRRSLKSGKDILFGPNFREPESYRTKDQLSFEALNKFLSSLEFFSSLEDFDRTLFCEACKLITLKSSQVLANEGSECFPAFIVQTGRVLIIKSSGHGKELIVEIVRPGDLFGLIWALGDPPIPHTARADKESRIIIIPKKSFHLILETYPQLAVKFASYIASRLSGAYDLARAIAYDDATSRVSSVLSALLDKIGTPSSNSKMTELEVTRQELGDLTGMTGETVVRVLKNMQRAGIVMLGHRGRIQICDRKRLFNLGQLQH